LEGLVNLQRRHWPLACLSGLVLAGVPAGRALAAAPGQEALRLAMARALALRDEAVRSGDQPYGAVVLYEDRIVGEAPSRVVTRRDVDAHAEREALRDAQRRLGRSDLAACLLVSSSRPCRLCESAAARLNIARMIHGESLLDAGKPAP
jgi:tRNA(Arg) A34 adenosine deaminase TadA